MNKYVTTFFRNVVCAISSSHYDSIQIRVDYDDGSTVYLKGNKIFCTNMPTRADSNSTFFSTDIEEAIDTLTINLIGQMPLEIL